MKRSGDAMMSEAELVDTVASMRRRVHRLQRLVLDLASYVPKPREPPPALCLFDMRMEIFSRLAVSDLLICERVCRTWRADICASLVELNLAPYACHVGNSHVAALPKYHSLRQLSLRLCSGVDPDILCSALLAMPRLRVLDVYGCRLQDFRPLAALTQLRVMTLGNGAPLLDTVPSHVTSLTLGWCSELQTLHSGAIDHLTQLAVLKLHDNDRMVVEEPLPPALAGSLRHLHVRRQISFQQAALEALATSAPHLESLHLVGQVAITGTAWPALPHLVELSLEHCQNLCDVRFGRTLFDACPALTTLTVVGRHLLTAATLRAVVAHKPLQRLTWRCSADMKDDTFYALFLTMPNVHYLELRDAVHLSPTMSARLCDHLAGGTLRVCALDGSHLRPVLL